MFNYTLNAEIARQRQAEMLQRADRHHSLFRRSRASVVADRNAACSVIDLPTHRGRLSPGECLVA
jgi:hypothetical protein